MKLLIIILLLIAIEVIVRLMKLNKFPLYEIDKKNKSNYAIKKNQKGVFAGKYLWSYDGFGCRFIGDITEKFGESVVILGDSVVEGGLKVDQSKTIAALLELKLGKHVYPVACHGWSIYNEYFAIEKIPNWRNASILIWVINSDDIDNIGEAESEFSFPSRYPVILSLWLIFRFFYRRFGVFKKKNNNKIKEDVALNCIKNVVENFEGQIFFVKYCKKNEVNFENLFFDKIKIIKKSIKIINLKKYKEWNEKAYSDEIHPSEYGAALLAKILHENINNNVN